MAEESEAGDEVEAADEARAGHSVLRQVLYIYTSIYILFYFIYLLYIWQLSGGIYI